MCTLLSLLLCSTSAWTFPHTVSITGPLPVFLSSPPCDMEVSELYQNQWHVLSATSGIRPFNVIMDVPDDSNLSLRLTNCVGWTPVPRRIQFDTFRRDNRRNVVDLGSFVLQRINEHPQPTQHVAATGPMFDSALSTVVFAVLLAVLAHQFRSARASRDSPGWDSRNCLVRASHQRVLSSPPPPLVTVRWLHSTYHAKVSLSRFVCRTIKQW